MSDEPSAVEQNQLNADEAPETDQPTDGQELSLDNFDPSQIPENADREWFENRIKGFQADYTKKTQKLSEERQGIEEQALEQFVEALAENPSLLKQLPLEDRAVLDALGYSPEEDPEEFTDPTEQKLSELEQWKASIEQEQQANAQYEAEAEFVEEQLEQIEKASGQEFDEEEANWIFDMARARKTQRGVPDVKGAISLLDKVGKRRVSAFKESATKTPRAPGQGRPGSKAVDPKNEGEFLDYLTEVAQEAEASQK